MKKQKSTVRNVPLLKFTIIVILKTYYLKSSTCLSKINGKDYLFSFSILTTLKRLTILTATKAEMKYYVSSPPVLQTLLAIRELLPGTAGKNLLSFAGYEKVDALELAEIVRQTIANCPFTLLQTFDHEGKRHMINITASIGAAAAPEDADDPLALIRHADRALYGAKRAGRNQVAEYEK